MVIVFEILIEKLFQDSLYEY